MSNRVVVSFKIRRDLLERLDDFCRVYGLSRSEAIEIALNKLLHGYGVIVEYVPKGWEAKVKRYDPAPIL